MRRVPRDIPQAMKDLGIIPERENDEEVFGLCPGHMSRLGREDRKAGNWSVNKDTGDHNCFSCGYGGTFLDLTIDVGKMDVWEALRWIRRHGVRIIESADLPDYREVLPEPETRKRKEEVNEASLALFWRPSPQKLAERYITPEAAELYDVLWDGEHHGWVVPIRTHDGKLIGWQFKGKHWFDNYPLGVEKGECVYGLELLYPGCVAVLIESPLDCPRTYAAIGDHYPDHIPVSGYGAEITDVQMRHILRRTDRIMFALDNDKPGRKLTQALAMGEQKRGQIIRRGWGARFKECLVYNYGDTEAKDQGEQLDDDVLWSIEHAFPIAALRLGPLKRKDLGNGNDRGSEQAPPQRRSAAAQRLAAGGQRRAGYGATRPLRPARGGSNRRRHQLG